MSFLELVFLDPHFESSDLEDLDDLQDKGVLCFFGFFSSFLDDVCEDAGEILLSCVIGVAFPSYLV